MSYLRFNWFRKSGVRLGTEGLLSSIVERGCSVRMKLREVLAFFVVKVTHAELYHVFSSAFK
jgi:hypothetical protein